MRELNRRNGNLFMTKNELDTQKKGYEKLSNGKGVDKSLKVGTQTYSLGVMIYAMNLVYSAILNGQSQSVASEVQKVSEKYFGSGVFAGMEKYNKNREKELEKISNISQTKLSKDKENPDNENQVYKRLNAIISGAKQSLVQTGTLNKNDQEKTNPSKEAGNQQKNEPPGRD
ncbi:hypothetical protein [Enterococcus hirae]|uniref:hypothetical protein n=1 Tax=Enterococcus hirae TaxID=1354 RepID=UPI001A95CD83|nr:hypothetical protein [Enterococcus hirae]MBO1101407.1 hypothetical protein [Enterococcus hirae]